ncbi:MAG TPA: hypothetical protein VGX91_11470 [Candidatus Cybelea sp.]|jgi:A/G-specific adenine glycosylase|nr:hypothetical protein [Candidatus Cybelea sp.]
MASTPTGSLLQGRLLRWYRKYGRAELPWRVLRSQYRTLVSEFMLAQTQVERVVPKFEAFVERFPDFAALARASLGEVLRAWKGLGYNSRAVRLHRLAVCVVETHGGQLPSDAASLRQLPGLGPYGVAAVRAFAFDLDDAPVDTNIRRIVHRLCFGTEHPPRASALELDRRARALMPPGRAHDWNSAMMDLGATICSARAPKCLLCPLHPDCAAAPVDAAALETARRANGKPPSPQNAIPFERSRRFARGRIVDRLRELPAGQRVSLLDLRRALEGASRWTVADVGELVGALERDGLVTRDGNGVALRE